VLILGHSAAHFTALALELDRKFGFVQTNNHQADAGVEILPGMKTVVKQSTYSLFSRQMKSMTSTQILDFTTNLGASAPELFLKTNTIAAFAILAKVSRKDSITRSSMKKQLQLILTANTIIDALVRR
jgi:hypothetical protein